MNNMNSVVEGGLRVTAVGSIAHAALVSCLGILRPLPAFPDSPYMLAGDEIVWLGAGSGVWHPRRILLANPRPARLCDGLKLGVDAATVWHAPAVPGIERGQLASSCALIRTQVSALGVPAGFGVLLAGAPLRFPLDLAGARLAALVDGIVRDDAVAFEAAAFSLLGLGLGLTPSGDDFVGACLFARRMRGDAAAWHSAAVNLTRAAATRSNAISAALFGDLARGAAYAPLHDLAEAINGGAGEQLAAARALTAIGHSSGWDMLTGFMLGAAGTAEAIGWKAAPDAAFQPTAKEIYASSSH